MLLYHAGARRSAIAAFALKPALHLAMAISALVMATADDAVAERPVAFHCLTAVHVKS